MPFGSIFAALFFLVAAWAGVQQMAAQGPTAKVAGLLMAVLGLALAVGLLGRKPWARWAGLLAGLGLAATALLRADSAGGMLDLLLVLAGLLSAILLAVPGTGAPRPLPEGAGTGRPILGLVVVSALGLAGIGVYGLIATEPAAAPARALPASLSQRVVWSDFASGLARARSEDKPLLVNFNAAWCGYCKKMDGSTWKHPSVVERMTDVVAVRVDIDDRSERGGFVDADVAARYQVEGTPTQLLLDTRGQVLARAGGYQSARDFLTWLDASLGRNPGSGLPASGP